MRYDRGVRVAAAMLALAGCGRFGFAGHSDAPTGRDASAHDDGPARDAPSDTPRDVAGPDAFDQNVACMGFGVCDSFEAGALDTTLWSGNRITVDSTHVHRGMYAAHVKNPALAVGQGMISQLGEDATFTGGTIPTTFYVRAWLYLPTLPAPNNHLELISVESQAASSLGDYTFTYSNNSALYTQEDQQSQLTGVAPPTNMWFCIVMRITRSTTAGSLALTSDVLPATSLNNVITEDNANPLHDVHIGLGYAGTNVVTAQPAMDAWVDDVIVDPNPLTCAD